MSKTSEGGDASIVFHLLGWRGFVTLICIAAALPAGTLYAWAAYSADLRKHFGWNMADTTTVNTCGVVGDSVLVLLIGIMMSVAGPAITMVYCVVLLAGSFFGLYWQAAERNPSVIFAGFLYACNGQGSAGFFLVSMVTITTTWPEHMVGASIAVVEVAFTFSGALTATIYPRVSSILEFYLALGWTTLFIGLLMFSIHVKWSLLLKRLCPDTQEPSELAVEHVEEATLRDHLSSPPRSNSSLL
jgi:hypothetical protein